MPEMGSDSFDEFLAVIGEKIRLGGWERYRGGLDVKGNYYFIKNLVCELMKMKIIIIIITFQAT